jgi:hypothetical protein
MIVIFVVLRSMSRRDQQDENPNNNDLVPNVRTENVRTKRSARNYLFDKFY